MPIRSCVVMLSALAGCAIAGQPGAAADASKSDRDANVHDSSSAAPADGSASGCAYSGVLATWDFSGQPGSQTSTAGASNTSSVAAAAIRRSTTIVASAGTDSINASNWPTSAQLDKTKYYSLSITAPAGCMLDATSVSIDVMASGTGPHSAAVATSADAFAHSSSVSTTAQTTSTISATTSGNLELRIYGFGATGTIGTMRVQNTLSVSGTLH